MTARPGVWAELMQDGEVEACLSELAAHGCRLHLAVPSLRVGDSALAQLTRRAADRGISVWAWPLLPFEQGYWIGESNVEAASELVGALLAWRERPGGLAVEGISFDLEPAHEYAERLRALATRRFDLLLAELGRHIDPNHFERARGQLAHLVDRVRSRGVRTHCVTFPLVLDDAPEHTVLEDALDIPVSGIDWDWVSFMVYQTVFANMVGLWLGAGLIHSYAKSARARFGDRAGIDLGVVGKPGIGLLPGDRYSEPAALGRDVAAAQAAGIPAEHIRIYGLKGLQEEGGLAHWLDSWDEGTVPEVSAHAEGFRNAMRGLSTALRVSRPR